VPKSCALSSSWSPVFKCWGPWGLVLNPGARLLGAVSVSPRWRRLYLWKIAECVPPAALIAFSKLDNFNNLPSGHIPQLFSFHLCKYKSEPSQIIFSLISGSEVIRRVSEFPETKIYFRHSRICRTKNAKNHIWHDNES